MTQLSPDTQEMLDSLSSVVAETLERKRGLGQYAVIWQDGKPVLIGEDGGDVGSNDIFMDRPLMLPGSSGHLKNVIRYDEVNHGKIDNINEEKILYPLLRCLPSRSVSSG
ncbi:hypothetical protein [Vreelandella titanicae]|uniref:hypothetical protein n=1 Tax=Vreelandella titanicae TaxID=664683 RepID=UPI003D2A90EE